MPEQILFVGWALSMGLVIATIWCVQRFQKKRAAESEPTTMWAAYAAGLFLAILVFGISQGLAGISERTSAPLLLDALFNTLNMFLGNRGIDLDGASLSILGSLAGPYAAYNALLYFLAPVSTLATIISLVRSLFLLPRMFLRSRHHDVFAFSEANRSSYLLAQSIQEHYLQSGSRCLVIFAGSGDDEENEGGRFGDRYTVFARRSLPELRHILASSASESTYLFMGKDEQDNLDKGLSLASTLISDGGGMGSTAPARIFILASSPVAMRLIDDAMEKISASFPDQALPIIIRRLDPIRQTVSNALDRYPVFLAGEQSPLVKADRQEESSNPPGLYALDTRRVLVVGSTDLAYEYLKGALWAGCLGPDIEMSLDLVAPDASRLKDRLALEAPEILDGRSERDYHLAFRTLDPLSATFSHYLREITGPLTLVFVDTGDELDNVSLAMRIREISDQQLLKQDVSQASGRPHPQCRPVILAAVRHDSLASSIEGLHAGGLDYDLHAVGSEERVFSYDAAFNPRLERYGRGINRAYRGAYEGAIPSAKDLELADRSYLVSEYDRNSSMASAMHFKYGLFVYCRNMALGLHDVRQDPDLMDSLGCLDWSATIKELDSQSAGSLVRSYAACMAGLLAATSQEERVLLARRNWRCQMEHDRWNAYMRLEGYEAASPSETRRYFQFTARNRDDVAKLHDCLVSMDDLEKADAVFEPLAKEAERRFTPYELADIAVVTHLPEILESARGF